MNGLGGLGLSGRIGGALGDVNRRALVLGRWFRGGSENWGLGFERNQLMPVRRLP